MCGRYSVALPEELLAELLGLMEIPFEYMPRYNAAPGQWLPSVIHDGEGRRAGLLRWGLVPAWAKDEHAAFKMINARAETIGEKPSFRGPFEQGRRCLIPADGFYEWKREGAAKQPYRIRTKDRPLFAMAGLYDTWTKPDGGKLHTFTILTTEANGLISGLHERMPVILRRGDEDEWLSPNARPERLRRLLAPYPEEEMILHPVTPKVGRADYDDPSCIEPFAAEPDKPIQQTLF